MVRSFYGPIAIDLCLHWPVAVSQLQATRYATSKGCVLPTEMQLVYAKSEMCASLSDNHSFSKMVPMAVCGEADGVTDMAGNGWEWSSTVFAPFPGFEVSELYPGYSSDFL